MYAPTDRNWWWPAEPAAHSIARAH
ncbi:trp operon leader peptide [Streptomyces sp. NPDC019396]